MIIDANSRWNITYGILGNCETIR